MCDRVVILRRGAVVAAGRPEDLAEPGVIEIETAKGVRRFPGVGREEAPRLVAELVAAGEQIYGVRVVDRVARGDLHRGDRGGGRMSASRDDRRVHTAREPSAPRIPRRPHPHDGVSRPLCAGHTQAFKDVEDFAGGVTAGLDATTLAGATLFGLSMFGTLFLGAVLAIFLTLGVVRGDAERGLLQPLVVRPVGRATFLLSRLLAAARVCRLRLPRVRRDPR